MHDRMLAARQHLNSRQRLTIHQKEVAYSHVLGTAVTVMLGGRVRHEQIKKAFNK